MHKNILKTVLYALALGFCQSGAGQTANFNSLDGTPIRALVFHPAASSNNTPSRGTVIALHGCGG